MKRFASAQAGVHSNIKLSDLYRLKDLTPPGVKASDWLTDENGPAQGCSWLAVWSAWPAGTRTRASETRECWHRFHPEFHPQLIIHAIQVHAHLQRVLTSSPLPSEESYWLHLISELAATAGRGTVAPAAQELGALQPRAHWPTSFHLHRTL